MADLGLQVYRMGIEWARVEPSEGVWDEAALAHYRDEVAGLVAAGTAAASSSASSTWPGTNTAERLEGLEGGAGSLAGASGSTITVC